MPPSDAVPCGLPEVSALAMATPDEVAAALAYALRHDERGKPRGGAMAGWDFTAGIAAEHLAAHLARAGFVVMKRRPTAAHTAG